MESEGIPIGFCQHYEYSKSGKDWQGSIPKEGTYSIDYFISNEDYLGKGYVTKMICALNKKIFDEIDARRIIAKPEIENMK